MNGARFKWPPLSDSCAAQKWLLAHRASIMHGDEIRVPRWRFDDGSVLIARGDDLHAVVGPRAHVCVRQRARRRARWHCIRVWWQRRPIWGDQVAREQVRVFRAVRRKAELEDLYRGCDGSEGF